MKSHGLDMKGKFIVERVSTLPSWTSADEGREIYVEDENKKYYGNDTEWVDYTYAETDAYADGSILNWPFKTQMPDNGRFAGDIGQYIYASTFSNSSFFVPYNSGTATQVGKFIHNNNDYGGSAGSMTQTTIDLIETQNRDATDKRYGVEFFIMQLTAGSGTLVAITFPGGTRYLMSTTSSGAYWGINGYGTFSSWIRAINGPIGLYGAAFVNWEINGVTQLQSNYDLSPDDGWIFVKIVRQDAIGYDNGFPFFCGNDGNGLQIAIPAMFNGYVYDIEYTAPIVNF